MTPKAIKYFEDRVMPEPNSGCWIWIGPRDRGYGAMHNHKTIKTWAHRFSYVLAYGEIPAGLQVDHKCRNRSCVNPAHLEAVTQVENIRRWVMTITHCVNGHRLPEHAKLCGKKWRRKCSECHRQEEARRRKRVNQTNMISWGHK